jgi:hypothetical protein
MHATMNRDGSTRKNVDGGRCGPVASNGRAPARGNRPAMVPHRAGRLLLTQELEFLSEILRESLSNRLTLKVEKGTRSSVLPAWSVTYVG